MEPLWRLVDYARVEAICSIVDPHAIGSEIQFDSLPYTLIPVRPGKSQRCRVIIPLVIVDSELDPYPRYQAFGLWDVQEILLSMSYIPLEKEGELNDFYQAKMDSETLTSIGPMPNRSIGLQKRFDFLVKLKPIRMELEIDATTGTMQEREAFLRAR